MGPQVRLRWDTVNGELWPDRGIFLRVNTALNRDSPPPSEYAKQEHTLQVSTVEVCRIQEIEYFKPGRDTGLKQDFFVDSRDEARQHSVLRSAPISSAGSSILIPNQTTPVAMSSLFSSLSRPPGQSVFGGSTASPFGQTGASTNVRPATSRPWKPSSGQVHRINANA